MAVNNSTPLTADRLRELFHYDAETGVFTRRLPDGYKGQRVRNKAVGCRNTINYIVIYIGKLFLAHRLAWLYTYGAWPTRDIDHINGDRSDNRICNLREATRSENNQNQRKARKDNKSSGVLGVSWYERDKKWKPQISINGKRVYLGYFDTIAEARAAYLKAKALYHPFGEISRGHSEPSG